MSNRSIRPPPFAVALETFLTFYFPRTEKHWLQGRETDSFAFGMWAAGNCANHIQDIRGWFGQSDLRQTANLSSRRARMASLDSWTGRTDKRTPKDIWGLR